jgi:hypothetical protein
LELFVGYALFGGYPPVIRGCPGESTVRMVGMDDSADRPLRLSTLFLKRT